MDNQLGQGELGGISRKMLTFSRYLQRVRLPEAAEAYAGFARELENGIAQERLGEICQEVLTSLRAGPMSISDRHIIKPDGSADEVETDRYYALIDELRKFARSNVRRKGIARFFPGFQG